MKTHEKKRLDIVIEAPILPRLLALLDDLAVSGYTVVPARAGRGRGGAWRRDGLVGEAGRMMLVFCVLDESRLDAVTEPVFELLEPQLGIVTVSDVSVIRSEHF